ncbi:repulsive guidance molecule A [Caerostris extrusa]|uniref:Repulsive guidance molecule A n=1 Tax=Caerostris extrusa TaxID=172846 RepID=A0AAV4T1G2_CAEEX|nr:repulsive guidance molecule A [Caerostris extrusa]
MVKNEKESLWSARSAECKIQLCSRQYARTVEEGNISQGATYRYCSVLKSYSECVRTTARLCRGDLSYHTVQSLVAQWTRMFECPRVLERGPQPMPHPRPQGGKHKLQKQPHQECSHYRPGGALTHCGLFGDPHLRTFYDELQTCSIPGAWPLLDNPHLAVQVTNDPVGKGTVATAITKGETLSL